MTENDIHKCLLSYGIYPMTLILKELEEENRFETCAFILKAVLSYRVKYPIIEDDIPTQWSEDFEKEYYSYFKALSPEGNLLARENMEYYLKDIKKRLQL